MEAHLHCTCEWVMRWRSKIQNYTYIYMWFLNNGLHPQKSGGEEPLTHLPSLLKLQRPFSLQGLLCPVHTLFYSTTFMSHDSQAPSHDLSFHSFPFSNLLPAPDHGSGHFNIITSSHAKQGGYCSSSRLTWASLTRPSPNENMGCCVSSRLIWACLTGPNPIKLWKIWNWVFCSRCERRRGFGLGSWI